METEAYYIEALKKDIEDKFNQSFRSATDFDKLETLVKKNSPDTLNSSTLKRIWGYSKNDSRPRRSTLTVLARVLGFRDWESYVEKKESENKIESGFTSDSAIDLSTLKVGDTISFKWKPNRSIVLRCFDKEIFEVISQENSSLRAGDTFHLHYMREGHPIYCYDVTRDAKNLGDYVAGKTNGIYDLKLLTDK